MKRISKIMAIFILCFNLLTVTAFGRELVAVGQIVGLELQDGTVTVAAIDDELGAAAEAAGMEVGDQIVSIDGKRITSAEDVRSALESSKGSVTVTLCRDGKQIKCSMEPEITAEGPKLGLYLRQGVSGVGTVTWYDPESGKFGALGHGVNDSDGQLLKLKQGSAFNTKVVAVRKGKAGDPGQLMGSSANRDPIAALYANLPQGVFGDSQIRWEGKTVQVAAWEDVKTGPATILSTISGNDVQEYSVEIVKIYPKTSESGRNLLIRVTDPHLLECTGGIVQGMSGSPILQDGKIVGAVTHVLVNDPTTGYGIFIENMLDAAA